MKKRFLSVTLAVLMVLSLFSVFTISASAASIEITKNPVVYISGEDEYNIVWMTSTVAMSYVTINYSGKTYNFYDQDNGVVRTDDKIHTVRVPMQYLDGAGSYTVNSTAVTSRSDYTVALDAKVSLTSAFKGYHNQSSINIGVISDSHLSYNTASRTTATNGRLSLASQLPDIWGGVDMLIQNGDITDSMESLSDLELTLEEAYRVTNGSLPILYAKGNHECRGEYSYKIIKYLSYSNGEFFSKWKYGPIAGITIDLGEDKEDSSTSYYGLTDMDHYFEYQYEWLSSMGGYGDGQYHLLVCHGPDLSRAMPTEYKYEMANYGTDLLICGHTHDLQFHPASDAWHGNRGYPVLNDGGHDTGGTMRTSTVTFSNGDITVRGFSGEGNRTFSETVKASNKSAAAPTETTDNTDEITSSPAATETEQQAESSAPSIPTAAGVSMHALKGAGTSVSITAQPVVFDCGMYYRVVFQTTPGVSAAGYVEFKNSSTTVTYMDTVTGKLRPDSIHSVQIPKTEFDTMTYRVRSRSLDNYTAYGIADIATEKQSYGPYVNGAQIKFTGDSSGSSYNDNFKILVVGNTATGSNLDVSAAQTTKRTAGGSLSLVVSMGNVANSLNTSDDFANYLKYMNALTGGTVPVLFLRGENETKGAYAPYLSTYIHNYTPEGVMGKFYFDTSFGILSTVGFDTATTAVDSSEKYHNLAAFDSIRAEQPGWAANTIPDSFKGTYNIVFAHGDGLTNYLGVDFTKSYKKLATDLVVTAGSGKASFTDGGSSYSIATVGSPSGDDSYGLLLTCSKNKITVSKLAASTTELGVINDTSKSGAEVTDNPNDTPVTPDTPDDKPNTPDTPDTSDTPDRPNHSNPNGGSSSDSDPSDGTTGNGTTDFEPDSSDSIDGSSYVRVVPEGWYNDYLSLGFKVEDITSVSSNGTTTEAVFIESVSYISGIDLTLFSGSTNAEKASEWAQSYGIYTGYLATENPVTDNVINTVVSGLFAA